MNWVEINADDELRPHGGVQVLFRFRKGLYRLGYKTSDVWVIGLSTQEWSEVAKTYTHYAVIVDPVKL